MHNPVVSPPLCASVRLCDLFKQTLYSVLFLYALTFAIPLYANEATDPLATEVVQKAIEYWRDDSSKSRSRMTIHRPDWQREMEMQSFTKGTSHSLVRFTAPARDAGSASLKIENEMWSFSPKIRRVIRIPSSMMSQSWMGSDFSYNDLARDDEIVQHYTHRFLEAEEHDGKKVYVVEATPKDDAPVVWGKEIVKVREDYIMLEHTFYDQSMEPVKRMEAKAIGMLGGRLFPTVMRMGLIDKPNEWTEIEHLEMEFGAEIPARTFTTSFLQNPRL